MQQTNETAHHLFCQWEALDHRTQGWCREQECWNEKINGRKRGNKEKKTFYLAILRFIQLQTII